MRRLGFSLRSCMPRKLQGEANVASLGPRLYYQGQRDLLSPPERIRADILRGFCEAVRKHPAKSRPQERVGGAERKSQRCLIGKK